MHGDSKPLIRVATGDTGTVPLGNAGFQELSRCTRNN
jgi:hypothetical protein